MISLNNYKLEFAPFPNGETRVNGEQIRNLVSDANEIQSVLFKYENDGDLIKLMFIKRHLDSLKLRSKLVIYYMPYSRMDRVEGDSVFTLRYVTDFINDLGFEDVIIIEPHSDVTPGLLRKSRAVYPTFDLLERVVQMVNFDKEQDVLFFPDAGAQKRYSKLTGYHQLEGSKKRNFQTGRIQSLQLIGDLPSVGCKAIILDDLCSFGGTFLLSAEKLKAAGVSEVYLLVAHCEESIYKRDLLTSDLITQVFTTDTILNGPEHHKIHIFPIGADLYEEKTEEVHVPFLATV